MDERELLGDAPIGKLSGHKILVVDDDEEIRIFLTTLFEDEGAAVFEAADGDEAIAQAAIDAGLSGIYSYPGTPSTEITEFVLRSTEAREGKLVASWTSNEKTAMEAALGVSYIGKRGMTCMKHVGLNVAADAFINSAITGANGGLLVVSADDPSMHSSQNEQDSRYFGNFAMIPILEPSSQQEAYDMTHYAFDLSEKFEIPVLMRITTRLAHSRAGVIRKEMRRQNELKMPKQSNQFPPRHC
jgi:indolepyruvate ferredoxin oxidoreductase alpha subunit